jgi:hypothetical protein
VFGEQGLLEEMLDVKLAEAFKTDTLITKITHLIL